MALQQSLAHEHEDPEVAGMDSDSDMEMLAHGTAARGRTARQRALLFGVLSVGMAVLVVGTWAYGTRLDGAGASASVGDFQQKWGGWHSHGGGPMFAGGKMGHHGRAGLQAVDTNGDGQVDGDEVEAVCEKVSAWVNITVERCEEAFEMADADKDDVLDREEVRPFLHELWQVAGPGLWKLAKKAWKHHGHVMQALKEIDADGNGELEGQELTALAEKLKKRFDVSEEVFQEALQTADRNGDGKLQRHELPKLLKALCKASREAHGDDDDDNGDDGDSTGEGSDLPGFAI